ncbi:MAG: hypothetical protein AAFQ19_10225 [Pseudomonadota bacterium]
MAPRLIVHAGFHKTGTTSIQHALRQNRKALAPLTIVLRPDMVALCESARAYSVSRGATDLALLQYEAAELAAGWHGTVLISSEDLAGHMPGRRGLTRYDATPRIMAALDTAWRKAIPGAGILLAFTTRRPEAWLASCHMQHLRATRMRLSVDDYAHDYAGSADLGGIVDQVAQACPKALVMSLPLEGPTDPLAALLQAAGVQHSAIPQMPRRNATEAEALRAALLTINRSDRTDAEARAARKALLARARA